MASKANTHDMSIIPAKLKGANPVGELIKLHLEEVESKFAIDISELVLPAILLRQVFRQFSKVLSVIGAAVVDALMDNEVLAIFNGT